MHILTFVSSVFHKEIKPIETQKGETARGGTARGGTARGVSSEKNYLATLPPEVLKEMMLFSTSNDLKALGLTSHKILPLAETVISFRTQNFLERLHQNLLKDPDVIKGLENPTNYGIYSYFYEKAKNSPTGSKEKTQNLKDSTNALLQNLSKESMLNMLENNPSFHNK